MTNEIEFDEIEYACPNCHAVGGHDREHTLLGIKLTCCECGFRAKSDEYKTPEEAKMDELKNELGAAILEVSCPYKNCPAGKGSKCRTKAIRNMHGDVVKGDNVRDSVHHVRYKKAKAEGAID